MIGGVRGRGIKKKGWTIKKKWEWLSNKRVRKFLLPRKPASGLGNETLETHKSATRPKSGKAYVDGAL